MIIATLVLFSALQAQPGASSPPTEGELQTRLETYEQQATAGRADSAELSSIARHVLQRTAGSNNLHAVIQTCSSKFADAQSCSAKLWALARRSTVPLEYRAGAAAALARRGDREAAAHLYNLVKGRQPAELAPVSRALPALPAERSVPLLETMLHSADPAAQGSACRVLGRIDAGNSRQALSNYLASAPRGTRPWFACLLSSAALGDPENIRMAGFWINQLSSDDLVIAADILMPTDRDRAVSHLLQVTREGRGVTRLEAAQRLASIQPEVTDRVLEQGLSDQSAETRAAALELYRVLGREPSRQVREFLLDRHPLVQLRAAETILAADERRPGSARFLR